MNPTQIMALLAEIADLRLRADLASAEAAAQRARADAAEATLAALDTAEPSAE